MKSNFPIVSLGDHVRQISHRNKGGAGTDVFSVTNSEGFTLSTDYFSKEVFSKDVSNYKIVRKNQFAYNPSRINVGSIDYLRLVTKALVSPLYIVFETDGDLLPDYLLRFLKSDRGNVQIRANTEGAVRDSLKFKGLENIKIPLPLLDDQKRIAHLLGKVEGLILQRKQHLKQLDALLKSVFLEMFGDPVRNEKGWETRSLGNIATIERGRFSPRPRNDPKFYNGPYPFIQTGDISRSNGRLREYTQTLNELGIKVSKNFNVGTIVIAIVGATIGETAILQIPTYAPDSVIGITPKTEHKASESVFLEFMLRLWKPVLKARAPEAARANINIETLRPLPMIWPDRDHRSQFASIAEKVELLKSRYQQSLADLESLYGALSQKAFKGELDLSRVPLPIEQTEAEERMDEPHLEPKHPLHMGIPAKKNPLPKHMRFDELDPTLAEWLQDDLVQLEPGAEFSVTKFIDESQGRALELDAEGYTGTGDDGGIELGIQEWDQVKKWVFDALKRGWLEQEFDENTNRVKLVVSWDNRL